MSINIISNILIYLLNLMIIKNILAQGEYHEAEQWLALALVSKQVWEFAKQLIEKNYSFRYKNKTV